MTRARAAERSLRRNGVLTLVLYGVILLVCAGIPVWACLGWVWGS